VADLSEINLARKCDCQLPLKVSHKTKTACTLRIDQNL